MTTSDSVTNTFNGSLIDLQNRVSKMYYMKGFGPNEPSTLMLGAMEELGELARALLLSGMTPDFIPSERKHSSEWDEARDPAREVGDTITYLLALCNTLGIQPTFKWIADEYDY